MLAPIMVLLSISNLRPKVKPKNSDKKKYTIICKQKVEVTVSIFGNRNENSFFKNIFILKNENG